jgi:hypothetical protein
MVEPGIEPGTSLSETLTTIPRGLSVWKEVAN